MQCNFIPIKVKGDTVLIQELILGDMVIGQIRIDSNLSAPLSSLLVLLVTEKSVFIH